MRAFGLMLKPLALALPVVLLAGGTPIPVFAQDTDGERSVVREQGVDFFGGDIRSIRQSKVDR